MSEVGRKELCLGLMLPLAIFRMERRVGLG